jgi:TRAP-type mannitol/chloroaromatic compound transport system substrate-binding protein
MRKWIAAVSAATAMSCIALWGTAADAADKKVRVQMGAAYPSSTAILGTAELRFVKNVKDLSGGSIDIKFFEPGALVPASQYFDAISNGSLDMAYTSTGYFTGKDIAFALLGAVPFGPGVGEYLAWFEYGGGNKLSDDLHGKYNIVAKLCGIIAPEASGWFRKEIKTPDDLKGLKMRFYGLGANVMQKMGVATQLLQAGEIFQALQLGTIDATEFSMPAMDLTLGFHQVAKHYYFPGWHQQASTAHIYISKKKWNEFSPTQKAIIDASCKAQMYQEFAESEAAQFAAMNELKAKGVNIHKWSPEILKALEEKWHEVVDEQKAKSPEFAKIWESYAAFRKDYAIWRENGYLK